MDRGAWIMLGVVVLIGAAIWYVYHNQNQNLVPDWLRPHLSAYSTSGSAAPKPESQLDQSGQIPNG